MSALPVFTLGQGAEKQTRSTNCHRREELHTVTTIIQTVEEKGDIDGKESQSQ